MGFKISNVARASGSHTGAAVGKCGQPRGQPVGRLRLSIGLSIRLSIRAAPAAVHSLTDHHGRQSIGLRPCCPSISGPDRCLAGSVNNQQFARRIRLVSPPAQSKLVVTGLPRSPRADGGSLTLSAGPIFFNTAIAPDFREAAPISCAEQGTLVAHWESNQNPDAGGRLRLDLSKGAITPLFGLHHRPIRRTTTEVRDFVVLILEALRSSPRASYS